MNKELLIGVDLGGTNVRSGLIKGSEILQIDSRRISSKGTEAEVLAELIASITQVMDPSVKAIGIGVPGILDTKEGLVYDVQNIPSWKKVPLKHILEEHFHIPVYLNNDANCFAMAEWHFGKGQGTANLSGLILGTGVAAGLICNGQLYEGRNCGAGEFGMIPYLQHNYEFYCSGNFFSHFYQITGEEAYRSAVQHEPIALQAFQEYGIHLSWLIKSILYAVDPEVIVLGGSVSKAFSFFKASLWEHLADFPYKPVIENIRIEASEKDNIAILGAAALCLAKS
ncbi:ROK family protein [Pedobacter caeni]|uniref:Glucokinase n=1 Tax=Pedobacter caeni TaxID=288992 RepID=A0A1M5GDC8_9SPHI|nr:ROK family protein [Pedobacter caeni]SHG01696.1 glucokinase [Pedobacter caeni]